MISNNVVCSTSRGSDQTAHTRSLIRAYACCLDILLLLGYWPITICDFKADCTGSSESILVKMSHCWKSHVTAQLCFCNICAFTNNYVLVNS